MTLVRQKTFNTGSGAVGLCRENDSFVIFNRFLRRPHNATSFRGAQSKIRFILNFNFEIKRLLGAITGEGTGQRWIQSWNRRNGMGNVFAATRFNSVIFHDRLKLLLEQSTHLH